MTQGGRGKNFPPPPPPTKSYMVLHWSRGCKLHWLHIVHTAINHTFVYHLVSIDIHHLLACRKKLLIYVTFRVVTRRKRALHEPFREPPCHFLCLLIERLFDCLFLELHEVVKCRKMSDIIRATTLDEHNARRKNHHGNQEGRAQEKRLGTKLIEINKM